MNAPISSPPCATCLQMINSDIILDDLLQSGNIVTEDSRLEELGCPTYGYFRYIQGYTFVRKYGTLMRYYVDIES